MSKLYDHASISVERLLQALWHSEFQFRLNLYRTGIILLADVGLEYGMTKHCRRILDEIMPQVRCFISRREAHQTSLQIIGGADLEQRAFACFNLARCIIAVASDTSNGFPSSGSSLFLTDDLIYS
jgi:hypothetical protein